MRRFVRTRLVMTAFALSLVLSVLGVEGTLRPVLAQDVPQVEVAPNTVTPGATVTLRGSGWPAGATLRARMYREADLDGPGADLGMTFQVDADSTFSTSGVIPPTLFGAGNRGNVEVTPGTYTIVVRAGLSPVASTTATVDAGTPCHGGGQPSVPHSPSMRTPDPATSLP